MSEKKQKVTREDVMNLARELADKEGGQPDQYLRQAMDILMKRHGIKRKPISLKGMSEEEAKRIIDEYNK